MQGSADWYNDKGFYVGAFASQIDYDPFYAGAELEFDLYGGFANAINDSLSYDIGYAYYTDPGASDTGFELDYGEIYTAFTYRENTNIKIAYSDNYSGDVGAAYTLNLSQGFQLSNDITLTLEASNTHMLDDKGDGYWFGADNITHWGVSTSKNTGGFAVALSSSDADASVDVDDIADDRVFVGISRSF